MTNASTDHLVTYLADLVERLERFGVTVLPPNHADDVELGQAENGDLTIDLQARLPVSRGSADVELDLFEQWARVDRDAFSRREYRFELRHRQLDYRRAFHLHDVDRFVRAYHVATHEHCESPTGAAVCRHYFGPPVTDAFDAFDRLYDLWLTDTPPDCVALRCLG